MGATPFARPLRAVLIDPDGEERSAVLQGEDGAVLIGRAPENSIQVISPYISRRHAELTPHHEGALFRDLRSTSGSYIDGRRVDEVILQPGDAVRLGSPDGIRLLLQELDATRPLAAVAAASTTGDSERLGVGHTEVLQVAALESSPYLSGLIRAPDANARRRDSAHKKTEQRLLSLIGLTQTLLEVDSIEALTDRLLGAMMELLPVERGMVLLHDGKALSPTRWMVRGEGTGGITGDPLSSMNLDIGALEPEVVEPELPFLPIGTVTERVFREGVGLLTLDALSDQRLEGSKSVFLQSVRSILAAPIHTGERVAGVLYLDTRRPMRKEDADALEFLMAVARQAGMVFRQLELLAQQKRLVESMMKALAASIDKRDGLTAGHSARVAHYSVGTARVMGLQGADLYAIYYAALLHDYGKIGVDDAVLRKPGRLTPAEYTHIQLHPRYSYEILSKIEFPPGLEDLPMMAASHHERMDGKGYPFGLSGDEIPLAGRIIAIADVYDSLTRKRHYRDPMPTDEVLAHLEEGRGDRFDPACLDGFMRYHADELAMKEERRSRRREASGTLEATSAVDGEKTVDAASPTFDLDDRTPPHPMPAASRRAPDGTEDEDDLLQRSTVRVDGAP